LSLAAGSSDKAAPRGKSKGLPEREGRRKEKRLFFDTSEATILLKTKVESFEKGQNELVFRNKFAPKCTPKSRFFPIRDLICTSRGPNYRGLHGVSKLLQQTEIGGARLAAWGKAKLCGLRELSPRPSPSFAPMRQPA
jgi:hypothetical protein